MLNGDEDVVAPGIGHSLRLAQLLTGDADGTECELAMRDLDAAVSLDVRPIRESVAVAVLLPAREIVLESIGVDDCSRRLDLLERHAGRRATASISTRSPGGSPA